MTFAGGSTEADGAAAACFATITSIATPLILCFVPYKHTLASGYLKTSVATGEGVFVLIRYSCSPD